MRLDRPDESYLNYGIGSQIGLGKDATLTAVTAMVRAAFSLENLRPAPGVQGVLKKVVRPEGYTAYMREDHGAFSPFPTSKLSGTRTRMNAANPFTAFRVHFDGEVVTPKKQIDSA